MSVANPVGLCRDFDWHCGGLSNALKCRQKNIREFSYIAGYLRLSFWHCECIKAIRIRPPEDHCEGVKCPSHFESLAKRASQSLHSVSAVIILAARKMRKLQSRLSTAPSTGASPFTTMPGSTIAAKPSPG